jgi:hypothetical protein
LVETLFEQFEASGDDDEKHALFDEIADNLAVHTAIEERFFYPAVRARQTEANLEEACRRNRARRDCSSRRGGSSWRRGARRTRRAPLHRAAQGGRAEHSGLTRLAIRTATVAPQVKLQSSIGGGSYSVENDLTTDGNHDDCRRASCAPLDDRSNAVGSSPRREALQAAGIPLS